MKKTNDQGGGGGYFQLVLLEVVLIWNIDIGHGSDLTRHFLMKIYHCAVGLNLFIKTIANSPDQYSHL